MTTADMDNQLHRVAEDVTQSLHLMAFIAWVRDGCYFGCVSKHREPPDFERDLYEDFLNDHPH